jgi:hypothetical protein
MHSISGRVVLKESGVGIPDLLVGVYDLGKDAQADKIWAQRIKDGNPASMAALGTVLTNDAGEFALTHDGHGDPGGQKEGQSLKNGRRNLFLMILAPEESGKDLNSWLLFSSAAVRYNAGPSEQFLIRLTDDQLKKAGIPNPVPNNSVPQDSATVFNQLKESGKNQAQLSEGLRGLHGQRLEKRVHPD